MQKQYKVSDADLEVTLRLLKETGGTVEKELIAPGLWLVTVTLPDGTTTPSDAQTSDPTPVAAPATVTAGAAGSPKIGVLSAKYESGKRSSAAIGNDSTGGFSYGKYQIATKTGTMDSFLDFCAEEFPAVFQALEAAGGEAAALAGLETFKQAWRQLAQGAELPEAEHAFIKATHYTPFVERLKAIGLFVGKRSFALKNVCWSVAVQHGPGNKVVKNALDDQPDPATLDDETIIKEIYEERSNVNKYFSKSTSKVKAAVKARFQQELADALVMLKA